MFSVLKLFGRGAGEPDIAKLKKKGRVGELIKALSYSSPYPVRGQNVNSYTKELAHKKSIEFQLAAAQALAEIGGEAAVEPMIELVGRIASSTRGYGGSYYGTVWRAAGDALSSIRGAAAVGRLLAALSNRGVEQNVRELVIDSLARIRDPRATALFVAILSDPTEDKLVRIKAAVAASSTGDASCAPAIASFYKGLADRFYKLSVMSALAEGRHYQLLLDIMADQQAESSMREYAAKKLKELGWKHESNGLGATFCVFTGNWEACVAIGPPSVMPLISWLSHGPEEPLVRTLGEIGDPRAIDPLFAILDRAYKPLFDERVDGEIYGAGSAAMEEHKQKYDALRTASLRALSRLRRTNQDNVDSKAAARGIKLT
jgi:HEAT repeat protein